MRISEIADPVKALHAGFKMAGHVDASLFEWDEREVRERDEPNGFLSGLLLEKAIVLERGSVEPHAFDHQVPSQ